MSSPRASIVEYFGPDGGHKCGYCRGQNTSLTHGMWAHVISIWEYQILIDQGWRRSGRYCYKPDMAKTCCPLYTIKLQVKDFNPSMSHKRALKKFRNYLIHDKGGPKKNKDQRGGNSSSEEEEMEEPEEPKDSDLERMEAATSRVRADQADNVLPTTTQGPSDSVPSEVPKSISSDAIDGGAASASPTPPAVAASSSSESFSGASALPAPPKQGDGADPNKPKARKAKDLRRERAMQKGKVPKAPKESSKNKTKGLADFIDAPMPPGSKHTFEIRTVHAQTHEAEFKQSLNESYEVYKK